MRACEISALQWKHISLDERRLLAPVEDSRAMARLNATVLETMSELHSVPSVSASLP